MSWQISGFQFESQWKARLWGLAGNSCHYGSPRTLIEDIVTEHQYWTQTGLLMTPRRA